MVFALVELLLHKLGLRKVLLLGTHLSGAFTLEETFNKEGAHQLLILEQFKGCIELLILEDSVNG
jgi:hypothetical protein